MSDQLAREHKLILQSLGSDEKEIEDLNDVIGKSTPSKHLTRSEKKKLQNESEEKSDKEPVKSKDEVKKIKIMKDGQVTLVDKSEATTEKKPADPEREIKLEENKEGDLVMNIDSQKKKKNKKKIKGAEKKEIQEPSKPLAG